MEIATNNPQFVPPYVDIVAMKMNHDLAARLQGIEMQLSSLLRSLTQTWPQVPRPSSPTSPSTAFLLSGQKK